MCVVYSYQEHSTVYSDLKIFKNTHCLFFQNEMAYLKEHEHKTETLTRQFLAPLSRWVSDSGIASAP